MSDNEDYESAASGRDDESKAFTFALTPARANNDALDYNTKKGASLWKTATATLSDDPFECRSDGLRDFLELVRTRAKAMGWSASIMDIPEDPENVMGSTKPFLDNYGVLTKTHLTKVVSQYIATPTRAAQDSYQLYICLHSSLAKIGRDKVTLKRKNYTIGGEESGILFLKEIIGVSMIDTNATTSSIRSSLMNIDQYLTEVQYNITTVNQRVDALMESLRARGQTTHDLMEYLFTAYRTVPDKEFVRYIRSKQSDWEEGDLPNLNADSLMAKAEAKYKTLVEAKEWQAPTPEEQKIVALNSEIASLKRKITNETKRVDGKTERGNNKKFEMEAWMKEPPKDGEPKTKTIKNKEWHWCKWHERWTRHRPDECRLNAKNQTATATAVEAKDTRALQVQQATVGLIVDSEDE